MVPGAGNGSTPFYLTPEVPQYAAVASFYGVPTVSMRNALWDPAQAQPDSLFKSAGVSASDGSTPLDAGHKALADALVYYTQRTAEDLQLMPYGDWDQAAIDRDVPANFLYGREYHCCVDEMCRAYCGMQPVRFSCCAFAPWSRSCCVCLNQQNCVLHRVCLVVLHSSHSSANWSKVLLDVLRVCCLQSCKTTRTASCRT